MIPDRATTRPIAPVRLGAHEIGPRRRPLIIAEAGVNHDGSVEQALGLVDAAVEAGADVVKFQMFRADELACGAAGLAAYQQPTGVASQREMLRRLELSPADFARVREHCRRRRIEFLATPFGPADVDRLAALDVPALKLASTDLNNTPLVRTAVATGLPLIVSTGAATQDEIEAAVRRFYEWGALGRLVLLHCVSAYPTPVDAANLGAIAALRRVARVPTGYSDHTLSTTIAGLAVAAGACLLEKHLTLDRARAGPDHAMSLDPPQFAAYVTAARAAHAALGSGVLGLSPLEHDVRVAARKSVVAARAIRAGAIVSADMLTIKRPGGGVPPDELDGLIGRQAACDIAADAVIAWSMLS